MKKRMFSQLSPEAYGDYLVEQSDGMELDELRTDEEKRISNQIVQSTFTLVASLKELRDIYLREGLIPVGPSDRLFNRFNEIERLIAEQMDMFYGTPIRTTTHRVLTNSEYEGIISDPQTTSEYELWIQEGFLSECVKNPPTTTENSPERHR